MTAGPCPILVPAAGASRRMGGADKLLQDVDGQCLLRHVAETALASGEAVTVTLPPGHTARRAALDGLALDIIEVEDAAEGLSASFRAYLALNGARDPVMVLAADLPDLQVADLIAVRDAFLAAGGRHACRGASESGQPGHPVILPPAIVGRFDELAGDRGARRLLAGAEVALVRLPGDRAITDLDTPEDWAAWRARG